MVALTKAQENKNKAFGLTVKDISKVEQSTGWRYAQHSLGGDIRFCVHKERGQYELVIWLHSDPESLISIGVWANHNKGKVQRMFHKKLGTWCPRGMTSDGYTNQGHNPERGHVGDWRTKIKARDFMRNFGAIRVMVSEIETKLNDTGLYDALNNL